MSPIMPEGTAVRKAVQWISQRRQEDNKASLVNLIEQACLRFNLGPKDCEFLHRFFREQQDASGKKD